MSTNFLKSLDSSLDESRSAEISVLNSLFFDFSFEPSQLRVSLCLAVARNDVNYAKYLLKKAPVREQREELVHAFEQNRLDIAKLILEQDNIEEIITGEQDFDWRLTLYVVKVDALDIFRLLQNKSYLGFDRFESDFKKLIDYAAENGAYRIIQYLYQTEPRRFSKPIINSVFFKALGFEHENVARLFINCECVQKTLQDLSRFPLYLCRLFSFEAVKILKNLFPSLSDQYRKKALM